jgi:hypothetical protein
MGTRTHEGRESAREREREREREKEREREREKKERERELYALLHARDASVRGKKKSCKDVSKRVRV